MHSSPLPRQAADILFVRYDSLSAQRLNLETRKVIGDPKLIHPVLVPRPDL